MIPCICKVKINLAEREKAMKMTISTEKRQKLAWIGIRLFWAMILVLLGSMALEALIYGLATKVTQAYTGQFFQ
jgi:hypothetical protein